MTAPSAASTESSSPSLAATLARIEARLARIEDALQRGTTLVEGAAPMAAVLVDSLDDAAARAQASGADLDQRLRAALTLVDRLSAPQTVATLERALAAAESAPAAVAIATDTLDDLCARAYAAGVDVDARGRNLLIALEKLTSPAALAVLTDLLDRVDVIGGLLGSGILDPAPVAIVSRAGAALAESGGEEPRGVGPWGALRALSDPDVQRAVGFGLRFAKRFGSSLAEGPPPTSLPAALPPVHR